MNSQVAQSCTDNKARLYLSCFSLQILVGMSERLSRIEQHLFGQNFAPRPAVEGRVVGPDGGRRQGLTRNMAGAPPGHQGDGPSGSKRA